MESYQGTADYIALCFAEADLQKAEEIMERLNAARLRVWSNLRGCNLKKKSDAARFAASAAVIILISSQWLEHEQAHAQLRAAAEQEKTLVLLFLDDGDLSTNEELRMLLSRSVRMLDYNEAEAADCLEELLSLDCITDCKMADDEEPDTKKPGLFGFLS